MNSSNPQPMTLTFGRRKQMKPVEVIETVWVDVPVGRVPGMENCSFCYSMDTLLRTLTTIDWSTGESTTVFFGEPGSEPIIPPPTITSKAF